MKRSKFIAVTTAAALGACGLMAFTSKAASGALPERPPRAKILERMKEKLDLTDDQIAQIKVELGAEKDTLKTLLTRVHDARVGLREAIHAADASEASVRAAAAKVGAVQADLAVERFKLHGRISPILTPEQKEKIKAFEDRIDEFMDNAVWHLGDRWSAK